MANTEKTDQKRRAMMAVRDYGVNLTHFRNAVSAWAGMNLTDMECLRWLFQKGVATPTELAKFSGLSSGATTAMLDRLEAAGWVERTPNPQDRRGWLISPAKGSAPKVAGWFESARVAQDELLSRYSESEQALIADVFERFSDLWQAEGQKVQRKGN